MGLRVSRAIWPGTSAVEGMVEALDRAESEALVNGPGTGLRPWVIVRGLLRTVLNAAVMVAIYYVVPLEGRSTVFLLLELGIGLSLLAVMITWQVRAIVGSEHPGIRASYALAATTPMFLLLFSAAYVILSLNDSAAFSEPLSRSDSIYFTVTVFSTVGFGDITPVSEAARLVAVAQMILDLVVLGLGVRLILSAVQRGRAARERAAVGRRERGEGTSG